ncbi:MAG: hypothetical protein AAF726_12905 [Planctomycetota bacterium]
MNAPLVSVFALALVGCAATPLPSAQYPYDAPESTADWRKGDALRQGYVGVNTAQELERSGGNLPPVDGSGGSIDQYPVIGGGAQFKLGGDRASYGLEALLSIGGRANGGAFVLGGGGAAVAVSLDLLLVDVYGGPFFSLPLGDRMRAFASAGPLMQFASYHQSATAISPSDSGNGFGFGGYARTGLEFQMSPGSLIGFVVRWSSTGIDLSSGLGDLDLESVEVGITYSLLY